MLDVAEFGTRFTSVAAKRASGDLNGAEAKSESLSSASDSSGKDGATDHLATSARSLAAADGHRGEILIVEDDVRTARALQLLLKQAGYTSRICHTGADALGHAERQTPLAALIDVHLGDLSGLVLAKELRRLMGDRVPIIMVSGDTSMETLNSLKHVGATYFFSKPMNPATLVEQLREWVP